MVTLAEYVQISNPTLRMGPNYSGQRLYQGVGNVGCSVGRELRRACTDRHDKRSVVFDQYPGQNIVLYDLISAIFNMQG